MEMDGVGGFCGLITENDGGNRPSVNSIRGPGLL